MDIGNILGITIPVIVTVLGSVRWMDSRNREDQKRQEDRHREDIKIIREDQNLIREEIRHMDSKWERLFEKFLELRK